MEKKSILIVLCFSSFLGSPIFAEIQRYNNLCEASAAEWIDDTKFAVASDDLDKFEDDRKDSLAIYEVGNPGPIVWTKDLGKLTDIEASTQLAGFTFWITSHSKVGQKKREKLFVTKAVDGVPNDVGKKYKNIRLDVKEILSRDAPSISIESPGPGLNIEGLTFTPAGSLLLGLRSPLTDKGEAIIVDIGSPFDKVGLPIPEGHSKMDASPTRALALGGKGIRSIERLNDDLGYLIIAGASQAEESDFALYRWDGMEMVQEVQSIDFGEMNPEALIVWPDGKIQILGDNGGKNCSDNPSDGNTNPLWFPSTFLNSNEVLPTFADKK